MASIQSVYGLQCQPFQKGEVGPDDYFHSRDVAQASAAICSGVKELGLVRICGNIGTGVSFAAHRATSLLVTENYTSAYYAVFHICPRDFYKETCRIIGAVPGDKGRQAMITAIRLRAGELKVQGRPLVLILDNAENIPDLVMNDLAALMTADYGLSNQFALVMCGTKTLQSSFQHIGNTALVQELTYHYTMKGLSEQETADYVKHKLRQAGATRDIVNTDVLEALYDASSRGNCKAINQIMRAALFLGAQFNRSTIDMEVFRSAVEHVAMI